MQPDSARLLDAWERGQAQSPAARALLLLDAAEPAAAPGAGHASIGERDARLIGLRERWFGSQVECLSRCPHCGQPIELGFSLADIRLAHAGPDARLDVDCGGRRLRLRLPNGADLLSLAGETDALQARRRLLARCVVGAGDAAAATASADDFEGLSTDQFAQIGLRMAELDPQAEVLLDLVCPDCGSAVRAPFEIENFLWAEVDAWARELLVDVHRIAAAYGWSEREILSLGTRRRRVYLDLIA